MFTQNRSFSRFLVAVTFILVFGLILTACGGSPPQTSSPSSTATSGGALTLLSITGGTVYVQKPGSSEWQKAGEGMTLEVNYKVKTDTGSKAKITFFEGSTIELDGDTIVSMAELGMEGAATTIKVKQEIGQTVSHVQKLVDPASRYDIETTAAVAAVRGTIVFVGAYPNGNTVVGNIQGLVSVIAQGVEVQLTENTHSTVTPGNAPGQPEQGSTPTPTPTGTTTSTSSTTTTATEAKLGIALASDPSSAFPGDTLKYNYTVTNPGKVPVSGISLSSDKSDAVLYQDGDKNNDKILDLSETWTFNSEYLIKSDDEGQLINNGTVSGKDSKGQSVTASNKVSVAVGTIEVNIDSFKEGDTVGSGITVAGSVNDPSVSELTLDFNGDVSKLKVTNGRFSASLNLIEGTTNKITLTVNKAGGVSVIASYDLEPVAR